MSLKRELDRIRASAEQIIIAVDKIGNADKLGRPIKKLGLSGRAVNCLARREIEYLDDLMELDRRSILAIRNMGKQTFAEINEKVKSLGFKGWDK